MGARRVAAITLSIPKTRAANEKNPFTGRGWKIGDRGEHGIGDKIWDVRDERKGILEMRYGYESWT